MDTHTQDWILATIVGGSLLMVLLFAAFGAEDWNTPQDLTDAKVEATKEATPLGLALTGIRVDTLGETGDAVQGGKAGYLMPFIIVSVHLLVVLIGAAYMARTKKLSHATDDKSSRAKLMLFKMEHEAELLEEETYVVTHRGQSALNPLDPQDDEN